MAGNLHNLQQLGVHVGVKRDRSYASIAVDFWDLGTALSYSQHCTAFGGDSYTLAALCLVSSRILRNPSLVLSLPKTSVPLGTLQQSIFVPF